MAGQMDGRGEEVFRSARSSGGVSMSRGEHVSSSVRLIEDVFLYTRMGNSMR